MTEIGRLPPQSLDAERSVLGSILLASEAIDDVEPILQPDHFYSDAHRTTFEILTAMRQAGDKIDAVTVAEKLQAAGKFEDVGGVEFLEELLRTVPHAAHADYYAKTVRDKWCLRQIIYGCSQALRDAYDDSGKEAADILAVAERELSQVNEQITNASSSSSLQDLLFDVFDEYRTGKEPGIKTGFQDLDRLIHGLRPKELTVIAARPSVGKTSFVCNVAVNVAKTGAAVLFFSLEQGDRELGERMLSAESGLSLHAMRGGEAIRDGKKQDALMLASQRLGGLPISVTDASGLTVSKIAAITRIHKRRHDIKLVVVDYLQLIEPDNRREPREQQVSAMSRQLKGLAKDTNIAVVMLAQLNREIEARTGKSRKPRLSDLRESGSIEQDADTVLFLYRPSMHDEEADLSEAWLYLAKQRNGPTGDVRLAWFAEIMKFENAAGQWRENF